MPPLNLVGDLGGGGTLLALGIVARDARGRASGKGQVVDAAITDGVGASDASSSCVQGGRASGRAAASEHARFGGAVLRPFRDPDGKWISIGAIEPQFYALLLETLGLADDPLPHSSTTRSGPR